VAGRKKSLRVFARPKSLLGSTLPAYAGTHSLQVGYLDGRREAISRPKAAPPVEGSSVHGGSSEVGARRCSKQKKSGYRGRLLPAGNRRAFVSAREGELPHIDNPQGGGRRIGASSGGKLQQWGIFMRTKKVNTLPCKSGGRN